MLLLGGNFLFSQTIQQNSDCTTALPYFLHTLHVHTKKVGNRASGCPVSLPTWFASVLHSSIQLFCEDIWCVAVWKTFHSRAGVPLASNITRLASQDDDGKVVWKSDFHHVGRCNMTADNKTKLE